MSDYEQIVISAVRYAIGRMTYIVDLTVNYVLDEIKDHNLSDRCLTIIRDDIRFAKNKNNLGMKCNEIEWIKLLNRIEEVI